jgi:hypothetical protein
MLRRRAFASRPPTISAATWKFNIAEYELAATVLKDWFMLIV